MSHVYWKERLYFILSLLITIGIYYGVIKMVINIRYSPELLATYFILIFYIVLIVLYLFLSKIILIGHIQGNAVEISEKQFSEIYNVLKSQCEKMKINKLPRMYLLQSGGALNAFATRFVGRSYVVIYSDIMEKAFSDGEDVVEFVIAHELAHIKRRHILKRLLILPDNVIFLLTLAYSRACEITCDNMAFELSPKGAERGLILLSAGNKLFARVNLEEYVNEVRKEKTFVKWFSEILSTHPHISNRIVKIIRYKEEMNNPLNFKN